MNNLNKQLQHIRTDYTSGHLSENEVPNSPHILFSRWMEEAIHQGVYEPNAMNIATVAENGQPSSRIVLLREFNEEKGYFFYTNYLSKKGQSIAQHPLVAANFFWPTMERQIRIEGEAQPISKELSDAYFSSRPRESQIGAWVSAQSSVIDSRATLEEQLAFYTHKFQHLPIPRPEHWGGYAIQPHYFEFWQGGAARLHDRICYQQEADTWKKNRLAP